MKARITLILLLLLWQLRGTLLTAQHFSTTLPIYPSGHSILYGGLYEDQHVYVYGEVAYKDSAQIALMKLDLQGNIVWQRLLPPNNPRAIQIPILNGLHRYQDKLVLLSKFQNQGFNDWCSFRFFDTTGVLLEERTFPLTFSFRYINGCFVQGDAIYLYGSRNENAQGAGWISKMDRWDSLPKPKHFLANVEEEARNFKVIPTGQGTYLAGLLAKKKDIYTTTLFHLDSVFGAYKIHRFDSGTRDIGFIGLLNTRDSGVVFSSFTRGAFPGQPHSATVRKVDKYGFLAWEYRFDTEDIRNITDLVQDEEDNITGIGYTNYVFTQTKDFTKFQNAWHFQLSKKGQLKWMRHIIKKDKDADGAFYNIIRGDTALYYVGQHGNFLGFSSPLVTDRDFWVLGIGKDGCWNGDCNSVINIPAKPVGVSAVAPAPDVQLYPNPVVDAFRIHGDEGVEYGATLLDIHGRMLSTWNPRITGSAYSLPAGLPSGAYWLRVWHQGAVQVLPMVIMRP